MRPSRLPIWGRPPMLKVDGIQVAYGKVQALFGVTLEVKPGEILCLLGRNGAGKTTVMKSIMGLLPLTGGAIFLNGEVISGIPAHEIPRKRIGYVPQGRRLFPELTVSENIEIGLLPCKSGSDTRDWSAGRCSRFASKNSCSPPAPWAYPLTESFGFTSCPTSCRR